MKKKIALAMLLSVFMSSVLIAPSLSQDLTAGVSVGDWFKYEGTLVEYEADEGVPFPPNEQSPECYFYNETDWQKYTVTDVAGSNVTFDVIVHWKNGTETTYELELNITSSYGPSENLLVVQPNLEAGDQLREGYNFLGFLTVPPRIINETIMVEYELGSRETNVLDWYFPLEALPPEGDSIYAKLLWDKETGVLVKFEKIANSTITDGLWYFFIIRNELVDSSIDTLVIPEFPTGTVMLLTFIAVTICVDIYRRKKLKR